MLYNENLHEEEQHLIQQIAEQMVCSQWPNDYWIFLRRI